MNAYKIQVQVHCPPRNVNGNEFHGMHRCGMYWPEGKTIATLIVVRAKDMPECSPDMVPAQRAELRTCKGPNGEPVVLDYQFQALVEDKVLSAVVLKRERTTFEFVPAIKVKATKKSILDEFDEEDATKPEEPKGDKAAVEFGKPGNYKR